MKKCASCTKDLPDAALHCVFCGAKQPPAPATQGGMAKTAFGSYSASDMIEQLKGQQPGGYQPARPPPGPPAPAPYNPSAPYNPPAAAPYSAPYNPPAAAAATYTPPAPAGYSPPRPAPSAPVSPALMPTAAFTPGGGPMPAGGGYQPPAPSPPRPAGPGGVPSAPSNAATMFVQSSPAAQPTYPAPAAPMAPAMAAPAPRMQQQPIAQIPSAAPPYLGTQTAARHGRPIEPWKDSLRLWMFIWGGALLAAFATPLSIDPLVFNWDAIIAGEGTQKLPPLIMAAVGLLSIVLAFIPTSPAPRGLIGGVLGLAGIVVPMTIGELPPWQLLVPTAGMLLLIPGLVMRQEYRDAALPRIIITVGVIASLVVYLIPADGHLPLVDLFKAVLDVPGAAKIIFLLLLGQITIVVLSLLAWLPAPASGGANVFAWLLILWPMITSITLLVVSGLIGDVITKAPYGVLAWIAGGGGGGTAAAAMMMSGAALGAAYAVLAPTIRATYSRARNSTVAGR